MCVPARYVLAILGCVGMGIIYGLKVNFHVAIVAMVNHTAVNMEASPNSRAYGGDSCGASDSNSTSSVEDGPFDWGHVEQGILLSAYFWGYIAAQLPGGRIAERVSAKWVMFFSVSINVVCTLLTPLTAKIHWGLLIIMRVGEGIGGGVTFPGMHVLLAHWAPPNERSVMSSIVYAGTALGTVIFMLFAGLIAAAINWETVFYLEGGVSALWLIFWLIFIADSPEKQRFISATEREYITTSLSSGEPGVGHSAHKNLNVPWKKVFTSAPFWAIIIAHLCSNWGWYMVLIELPQYLKQVLNFKIEESAWLTALPFFCMWLFSLVLSKILDILRAKNKITTSIARKTATLFASVIPMICLIILCYIGCDRTLGVVLMTIAVTTMGGMFCGFLANHIDIAPNFAGTLVAITNTIATIPGITVPLFVGKLTESDPTINSWRIVFWVTVVLFIIEAIIYTIFASGEEQSWNNPNESESQPLKTKGGRAEA